MNAAQSLVTLHPMNPDLWLQLAEVYKKCMCSSVYTTCTTTVQSLGEQDSSKTCEELKKVDPHTDSDIVIKLNCVKADAECANLHTYNCSEVKGHDLDLTHSADDIQTVTLDDLCIGEGHHKRMFSSNEATCSSGMELSLVVATCLLRAR